jgi:predicted transcriptional regulator
VEISLTDIFIFTMENYFRRFVDNLDNEDIHKVDAPDYFDSITSNQDTSHVSDSFIAESNNTIAAKLAIYDSLLASPRVINLNAKGYDEFINLLATKTYQSSKEVGGNMPYTIIREIIENLIHAYFKEVVISIYDNGNTVRISDQGPGIKNKDKAIEPGFSTATGDMKKHIKGVGSGLPITKETLSFLGGAILMEDNLERGSVITLKVPSEAGPKKDPANGEVSDSQQIEINKRQKQVLVLVMELGTVGPSRIASELGVSLSTAYRDLIYLEEQSLIYSDEQGKRVLTPVGIEYLDVIIGS